MFIAPAYGKTYNTEKEVLEDWDNNIDFKIIGRGPYLNKKDFANYCDPVLDSVCFIYKDLKVTINSGILI